ncbi:RcnB family protein [Phenylobacterium sp. CCH12-B4]|uniref:RcnB family protein n=1 Tax=Phenylobacterium sp. CCH12-B4 TaxID=1768784 RepID=UPI0021009EC8|nr:RcnB family protein [Phenylobacterium sp. CCH12-B4]
MENKGTPRSAQPYGDHRQGGYDQGRDGRDNRYDNRGGEHWARGQQLPRQCRSRSYMVRDYRRYGYAPPPRGHAYYRTNSGDVVMVAVATGIIASIIAGSNNAGNGRPGDASPNPYGQQRYGQPGGGYAQPSYDGRSPH